MRRGQAYRLATSLRGRQTEDGGAADSDADDAAHVLARIGGAAELVVGDAPSYSANSRSGTPYAALPGGAMPSALAKIAAITAGGTSSPCTPGFTPGPNTRSGTCVSYGCGLPWTVPVVFPSGSTQYGFKTIPTSPHRSGK